MYDINSINIGEILRKYRKIKHFSLDYVGQKIYKTKATVSKYEKGEILPDLFTLLQLCNVLEINLSSIIPNIKPLYKDINFPFKTNKLYMYYITEKKLIESIIEFNISKNTDISVSFYNGTKSDNSSYAYYYEGSLDFSDNFIYINLKNISSKRLNVERVQIIINFTLSNNTDFFNCFITGLTPTFQPIVKRGIVSTKHLSNKELYINKLKISKEELQNIKSNNAWILDTKTYDEFFYNE